MPLRVQLHDAGVANTAARQRQHLSPHVVPGLRATGTLVYTHTNEIGSVAHAERQSRQEKNGCQVEQVYGMHTR